MPDRDGNHSPSRYRNPNLDFSLRSPSPDFDTGARSFNPRSDRHHSHSSHHHHRSSHHHHHHRPRDPRSRSRSPKRPRHSKPDPPIPLPSDAPQISTRHYTFYENLFASYLDIQKGLRLEDLDERERKGRFKSFVKHWNRGELASGWYDPDRKAKSDAMRAEILGSPVPAEDEQRGRKRRASPVYDKWDSPERGSKRREGGKGAMPVIGRKQQQEEESEDEFGPWIPGQRRGGGEVAMPTVGDLEDQNEAIREAHHLEKATLQHTRKLDRDAQRALLDELLPRAPPGTRERALEKKADLNAAMRQFRDKSPGAEMEVAESTLMGGGDGADEFKAKRAAMERKKNERELRKEAMLRERIREREERMEEARKKEDKTMAMLRALRDSMVQKQRG